jgi:hypothetical protein
VVHFVGLDVMKALAVPGLLTTLLGSGNTPGIDYGLLAKIQYPWRRKRRLPEGV